MQIGLIIKKYSMFKGTSFQQLNAHFLHIRPVRPTFVGMNPELLFQNKAKECELRIKVRLTKDPSMLPPIQAPNFRSDGVTAAWTRSFTVGGHLWARS